MRRLEAALEDILSAMGHLQDIPLGDKDVEAGAEGSTQVTADDTANLERRLEREASFNRTILVIYIALLCGLEAIQAIESIYWGSIRKKLRASPTHDRH